MKHSSDEVLSIFLLGAIKILLRPLMEDILKLCSNWSLGSSRIQFSLEIIQLQKYFCTVYDYAGKAGLCKGYWNPERKLGVARHFLEISKQQFYYSKKP